VRGETVRGGFVLPVTAKMEKAEDSAWMGTKSPEYDKYFRTAKRTGIKSNLAGREREPFRWP